MKKLGILLTAALTIGNTYASFAQIEFTGSAGAISPLLVQNPLPPLPVPTPPSPVPPLPDPSDLEPVVNEYTCTVRDYGTLELNGLQKVRLDITHPAVSALTIRLVSPLGTELLLVDSLPNDGANLTNTEFVLDSAENITAGIPPYTGRFLPLQSPPGLNNFVFEPADSIWRLRITIKGMQGLPVGEPGTLNSWSMTFKDKSIVAGINAKTAPLIGVYPNPSKGGLSAIHVPAELGFPYTLQVVNMLGQVVLSSTGTNADMNLTTTDLPKGYYMLSIKGTEQQSATRFVVE